MRQHFFLCLKSSRTADNEFEFLVVGFCRLALGYALDIDYNSVPCDEASLRASHWDVGISPLASSMYARWYGSHRFNKGQ